MSRISSLIYSLSFFSMNLSIYSQINQSETVIINADKISTSTNKTSSQVKVINYKEIQGFKNNNLDDILSNSTSLNINRNGQSGNTSSVSIRGMDTSHTIVVLDGIILNDPTNPNRQFDFSKINLNNIEKIEILKGSQGILYGSNAIGGVILLTSKKITFDQTDLKFSLGTHSTQNVSVNSNKKINNTALNLGIELYRTTGFSSANDPSQLNDNDGNKKINLNLGLNHKFESGFELDFKSFFLNEKIDLDKGGGQNSDDPNYLSKNQTIYSKIGLKKIFNEFIQSEFKITRTDFNRRAYDQNNIFQTYDGSDFQKGNNQTYELDNTFYFTENFIQNVNLTHSIERGLKDSNQNSSVFIYNKLNNEKTNYNLGIRLDYNKIFKRAFNYKLGISHQIDYLIFRSSFSTGLKAPTLFQLYNQTYGNINLKPELSKSIDFGFEWYLSNIFFKTTFYYTHLDDRHYFQNSINKNINMGSSFSKGIEEEIEYKLNDYLKQLTNMSLNESFDLKNGNRLTRRPEFILNHGYKITCEQFSHFLNTKFKTATTDVDNNGNNTKNKKFLTLNYDFEFNLSNNQLLGLNIENIFNSNFQEIWGYNNGGRMINLRYKLVF